MCRQESIKAAERERRLKYRKQVVTTSVSDITLLCTVLQDEEREVIRSAIREKVSQTIEIVDIYMCRTQQIFKLYKSFSQFISGVWSILIDRF